MNHSENKCHILSLPAKAGGPDILIPMVLAKEEHETSHSITEPLLQAIMQQKRDGMDECTADSMKT